MTAPGELPRRARLAFFTSCRELARDERVGRTVVDPVSGICYGHREALLETLVRALSDRRSPLGQCIELVLVLTDDDDSELDEAWRDGDLWSGERHVPTSSPGSCRTLAELLVRAPARPWRELPPDASAAPGCHADRRRTLRHEFERAIVEQLAAHRVDLVLCDSFMSVLGPLALAAYPGRILNVHPGITRPGARAQLLGPTPTRDAYTRAVYGFVITDDKRLVRRPVGPPVRVMYDGVPRDAVAVAPVAETGVTVHVVTERVDEGPIVLEQSYAFDPRAISPEAIRARNYELKRDLVPRALLKHLDELSA